MSVHKLIVVAVLIAVSPPPAQAAAVLGRVRHAGKAPQRARIKPDKDPEVCGRTPLFDESLVVSADGGLKNAVVSIEGAPAGGPAEPVTIDQVGCRYAPHVQSATLGSELRFKSSDAVFHNVHAFQDGRTKVNIALPVKGSKARTKLDHAGTVTIKCDAGHSWMQAFVLVYPHRLHGVTDDTGRFRIADVPPGMHKIRVWHEKLGEQTGTVEVKAGADAAFEVTLEAK